MTGPPFADPGAAWDATARRIRIRLLATPGAQLCPHPSCAVITQGGRDGLAAHQAAVHGIPAGSGT